MYKVALVDDDVLVLKFLEKTIAWSEYGFKVTGLFHNSLEAYEQLKLKEYDLVITDIGMPHLNGIELISLLKKEEIDIFKVILSCHDDFHYAQQALKLDVFDYLLKESIDQENMEELLQRLKVAIDEKQKSEKNRGGIEKFFKQNNRKLKTQFIEKLMQDNDVDNVWFEEECERLDMNFSYEHYTAVLCFVDKNVDAFEKFEKQELCQWGIDNIICETLKKFRVDVQTFYLQGKFFIIFPHGHENASVMYSIIEQALREMHREIERYLKITITSVIGEGNQLLKGLIKSMQELLYNGAQRFYYPHNSIEYLKLIPFEKPLIFQNYIEDVEEITRFIIEEDEQKTVNYIKEQMRKIKQTRCQPSIVQDWAVKLVLDIKLRLQALAYFEDAILITMTDKLVERIETFDHLEETVIDICKQLMVHTNEINSIPKNEEVVKAQKYIQMNISKKITLSDVADHLHLNPSYFSRLFKQVTGESFIEYVTRTKMERAKEMLDGTTKTIDQISIDLGFESKSYFLKTFKKFYGIPPKLYKYKKSNAPKSSVF